MKKFKEEVYLVIKTPGQLAAIEFALSMQADMLNDTLMDDNITTKGEFESLSKLSEEDLVSELKARRDQASNRIDEFLDTKEMLHNVKVIKTYITDQNLLD